MAKFTDIFLDVTRDGHKIPKENYLFQGKYPIIDQGQEYIAGYSDESEGLYKNIPVIIFGDHTRIIKYIDQPFFPGADGVKLLKAKDPNANYKYLYYALSYLKIPNTGYNRHFKWLKEADIKLPSQKKQQHIVEILDNLSNLISLRKQQLAKLDELVKARFVEMFGDPMINPFRYEKHPLSDYCDLQNGFAFKSEDYIEKSDVLNCRMSNIRPDGSFSVDYNPKYLPTDYWDKFSSYQLLDGDVIIAMTDMANDPKILGVPTIVSCFGKKMLLNQRVGKLLFRDNIEINRVYLMKALSHESVRARLAQSSGGGLQINVGKPAILNSIILYPPISQQNLFAEFSSKVDSERNTIQRSISKLEMLRKSLAQEYFG